MSRIMKCISLIAILLSTASVFPISSFAQLKNGNLDESKEPPLEYTLTVGEKSIVITEDRASRLEGTFNNPQVVLTPQPYRVFPYQGVSFKYPRSFTFEADIDDVESKNWTLSGNDFKIMYFAMNAKLTAAEFANSMVSQFGSANCKLNDAPLYRFGDKKLSGTTLNTSVLGNKMVVDVYLVSSTASQTKLLVLQDNLDQVGNRSIEGKAALELLSQSAKLNP